MNSPGLSPVLIIPGFRGSGPQHWQTLWEKSHPSFRRVEQRDWDHPICSQWLEKLSSEIEASDPDVILVAHSLACLLVAHWAANSSHASRQKIKAALLVAIPDPESPAFPPEAIGFSPVPLQPFSFPSIVVASTNDPFGTLDFSRACSRAWGSRLVNIGDAGHINADSGLGQWNQGFQLLEALTLHE